MSFITSCIERPLLPTSGMDFPLPLPLCLHVHSFTTSMVHWELFPRGYAVTIKEGNAWEHLWKTLGGISRSWCGVMYINVYCIYCVYVFVRFRIDRLSHSHSLFIELSVMIRSRLIPHLSSFFTLRYHKKHDVYPHYCLKSFKAVTASGRWYSPSIIIQSSDCKSVVHGISPVLPCKW